MVMPGKDWSMAMGSLEAALQERGKLQPGSAIEHQISGMHRPLEEGRVPSVEQVVNQPDRLRLWGRCGYVPESRTRLMEE